MMAERAAKPASKNLRLVWITGPYQSNAPGLKEALEAVTDVHLGFEAPAVAPSCVVLVLEDTGPVSEVRRLGEVAPGVPVVLFSNNPPALALARAAFRAGARGIIHTDMKPAQLVRSLQLASEGELVIPRRLFEQLVAEEPSVDLSLLSARRREILGLVAQGLTNAQIARRLYLSESSVKQHLRAAYKILGVKNRNQAARLFHNSETGEGR